MRAPSSIKGAARKAKCRSGPPIGRLRRRSALAGLHGPLGPGGPIGPQRRDHGIDAIADFTGVGAGVVTAVEDGLEIERHRRVAGQEGNLNRRQAILETDRVDVERVQVVEGRTET